MQQYGKALEVLGSVSSGGKTPTPLLTTQATIQLAAGQNDAAKQSLADLVSAEPNNIVAIISDCRLADSAQGLRRCSADARCRNPTPTNKPASSTGARACRSRRQRTRLGVANGRSANHQLCFIADSGYLEGWSSHGCPALQRRCWRIPNRVSEKSIVGAGCRPGAGIERHWRCERRDDRVVEVANRSS